MANVIIFFSKKIDFVSVFVKKFPKNHVSILIIKFFRKYYTEKGSHLASKNANISKEKRSDRHSFLSNVINYPSAMLT